MNPTVQPFFHAPTSTVSYIVHGGCGSSCAIIDPVLDFEMRSGRTATKSADVIAAFVAEQHLSVAWILETHVHADHLSAAPYLKGRLGGWIGIGAHVTGVQEHFGQVFNAGPEFRRDGSQFDHLFQDRESFTIGALHAEVLYTPGHTPDSVSYHIGDAVFVGDTLFMPDGGTARCDFPGGNACQLYRSIHRLLTLSSDTRMFVCHDYAPGGRAVAWETTVAEQRRANIHVHEGIGQDDFVARRMARDRTLDLPRLIIPAVQVNMRAGQLPPPEDNGICYLKMPINVM